MKRLISRDPDSGIAAYHERDPHTGATLITHKYDDVDGILDNNKLNYNHVNGWNGDRTLHKVATIPLSIITKWKLEKGVDVFNKDHWPKVRALLNDSEWRYLRTSPGQL